MKHSDLFYAKVFLAHNKGKAYTPEDLWRILKLSCYESTLRRKLRELAQKGQIRRVRGKKADGTEIAKYKMKSTSKLGKQLRKYKSLWELPR